MTTGRVVYVPEPAPAPNRRRVRRVKVLLALCIAAWVGHLWVTDSTGPVCPAPARSTR